MASTYVGGRFDAVEESVSEPPLPDHSLTTSVVHLLPPSKAQAYTAIFEDAWEQLAVLGDIAPDLHGKGKNGDSKPV
jgi:hypothetical protein